MSVDYLGFYHFLEGLMIYDGWNEHIDRRSKHRRLKRQPNKWIDKNQIHTSFSQLFKRYQKRSTNRQQKKLGIA